MVTRTFNVSVGRLLRRNAMRLIAIIGLTMISTALVTGLGLLAPKMRAGIAEWGEGAVSPHHLAATEFMTDAIQRLSYVFPAIFALVTALVVFMTITRLVESERAQMGCLKSLGYSPRAIIASYLPVTSVGCFVGSVIGLVIGYFVIAPILYDIVQDGFGVPDVGHVTPWMGLITAVAMFVLMLGVSVVAAWLPVRSAPKDLFIPKAPKAGKTLLIERVNWLWNHIAYRHKSTIRNIFRYQVRFWLTVVSTLLSTILVFMGLSLWFVISQYQADLQDTIGPISAVLVIGAITLNTLVVYNITNINIEERRREIATLKVLGYRRLEVAGYVFREIFWLATLGTLVALPAGFGAMALLFHYLGFGGVEYIDWYVWVFTLLLAMVSLGVADALLYRKLVSTDMNSSLKTIE